MALQFLFNSLSIVFLQLHNKNVALSVYVDKFPSIYHSLTAGITVLIEKSLFKLFAKRDSPYTCHTFSVTLGSNMSCKEHSFSEFLCNSNGELWAVDNTVQA
jgi:hypothetical protein